MNLLSFGDFKPSSESSENINDINSFLSDLKSTKKNNNQINIVKVQNDKKSTGPIEIPKVTKSPIQEKKDGISVNDCFNKGSSIIQSQKSNCEFSDSDIEFSDFMFSDNEDKKDKDKKNSKNIISINIEKIPDEPNIPEKAIKVTNNINIKTENIENNTIKNNLDEICLEDDDLNSENNVFELSDISNSDKKEEENGQASKEKTIIEINKKESINTDLTNNLLKGKNANNIINISIDDDVSKDITINLTPKKDQNVTKTDKIIIENKDIQIEAKEPQNDENKLFDNKIETEKTPTKKVVKKKKKTVRRNDIRSPLNILDDLQFSFDDKQAESNSTQAKQSDLQSNLYSPTVEKIKIEKVVKEKSPLKEQTSLPLLFTRSNQVHTKTGLENFEYSFVSNLDYYLSDFRSSFLAQFQNQVQKCFDYDNLVKKFLFSFTRELNDIITNNSNYQDYVPASFSDIESNLNSEFNQFSSFFSNSEKTEKDQFLFEEQFYPIDQVESIHSKLSNDCQFLLNQISKESQFLNQSNQDDYKQFNLNTKLTEISDLESKLIQIDAEKDFIDYRVNYIKEKNSEMQERIELMNKFNNNETNKSELDELITKLKELKKKNVDFNFNNNEHKMTVKEICDFCSFISSQFNSIPKYSKETTFFTNNSSFVNNMNMSTPSYQYSSYDSFSVSQNGIVEDVKNRLQRAKKMREETIADLRNYSPRYNFSIYA